MKAPQKEVALVVAAALHRQKTEHACNEPNILGTTLLLDSTDPPTFQYNMSSTLRRAGNDKGALFREHSAILHPSAATSREGSRFLGVLPL